MCNHRTQRLTVILYLYKEYAKIQITVVSKEILLRQVQYLLFCILERLGYWGFPDSTKERGNMRK